MTMFKTSFYSMLGLITAVSATGFAQSPSTAEISAPQIQARTEAMQLQEGSRYMVNQMVSAGILSNQSFLKKDVDGGQAIALPPATEFDVLEVSPDGKSVRIGLDVDLQKGSSASDLTVSTADLLAGRLSQIEMAPGLEDDDLKNVIEHEGMFAGKKSRGGMTYCYRDVKNTLLKMKKCDHYASGVRAVEGYEILQSECGMKPAPVDPPNLPVGAVCVMGGGRPCGGGEACGHIAIKVSSTTWFGAGYRGTPWLPDSGKPGYQHRTKRGCLVK